MWRCWWAVLAAVVFGVNAPVAAQEAADRWEKSITAFELQDRESPPAKGGNLFVGSSTARLWKVDEAFPEARCVNRGFGGSQLADVVNYVNRIVIPYRPSVIVLYAGDNDIAKERTPEQVRDSYRAFIGKVQAALPDTKIVWITIKPSPKRWELREQSQAANALIRSEIAAGKNQVEVDIWAAMLGENGQPRPELYVKDQLHLSAAGYELWNDRVKPHLMAKP